MLTVMFAVIFIAYDFILGRQKLCTVPIGRQKLVTPCSISEVPGQISCLNVFIYLFILYESGLGHFLLKHFIVVLP